VVLARDLQERRERLRVLLDERPDLVGDLRTRSRRSRSALEAAVEREGEWAHVLVDEEDGDVAALGELGKGGLDGRLRRLCVEGEVRGVSARTFGSGHRPCTSPSEQL